MMRPKLRSTATAIFIAALAICDSISSVTGLSRHFIIKAFDVDVRTLSQHPVRSNCLFYIYLWTHRPGCWP
ncbi:hypothetical protein EB796_006627 [Bugula neritina]|uniref:Secreted protein n=1 Tax=Bugula neritina TaxID=10212 RepID=A0A7J7KBT1_BUGNE|nr:hypothetical protein EB796_006627 [Bugula neritina]